MIGILEQNRSLSAPLPTILSVYAKEIWSMRKVVPEATYALRLKRSSDNAETDVELPETGFISWDSIVSAGGDLTTWFGASTTGVVTKVYGQKGFKDLLYTDNDNWLIENGIMQELFVGSGIPAIRGNKVTGGGLRAAAINGGSSIANTTIFGVCTYYQATNQGGNSSYAFGNIGYDISYNTNKRVFAPAADNSLRFYGANIATNLVTPVAKAAMIRTSVKNGDTWSDYINGVQNIVPTVLTGTDIIDDFFIAHYAHTYSSAYWSENIVFLDDQTANRETIEAEINADYQIF